MVGSGHGRRNALDLGGGKLRVVVLVHAYYLRDPRVRREAEALVRAGHSVDAISLNEGGEAGEELVAGVRLYRCNLGRSRVRGMLNLIREYTGFLARAWWMLARLHRQHGYDVAIVANMPNFLVFATFPWRFTGMKVILDLHDPAPETFASLFGRWEGLLGRVMRMEEWICCRYAHRTMTVNRAIQSLFAARTGVVPFVSHNVPDLPLSSAGKAHYDHNKPVRRLVIHGYIHQRDGLDSVLRVIDALNTPEVRFDLDIYGDGPFLAGLQAVAAELGRPAWCRFHGRYLAGQVTEFLVDADLVIATYLPSALANLRLPAKLLEAACLGVPAVCRDLPAIRAYFDDDCVFYFETDSELAQQLVAASSDYTEAERRAGNARQRLRGITWDSEGPNFVRFVETVAGA